MKRTLAVAGLVAVVVLAAVWVGVSETQTRQHLRLRLVRRYEVYFHGRPEILSMHRTGLFPGRFHVEMQYGQQNWGFEVASDGQGEIPVP